MAVGTNVFTTPETIGIVGRMSTVGNGKIGFGAVGNASVGKGSVGKGNVGRLGFVGRLGGVSDPEIKDVGCAVAVGKSGAGFPSLVSLPSNDGVIST
jgi:hypothetical protein